MTSGIHTNVNFRRRSCPQSQPDPVLVAGIAHLWFVTIHPFEDGNGRIARAIADLALARSEGSTQRFYSMSSQIRAERNRYYDMQEETQKGSLNIPLAGAVPAMTWRKFESRLGLINASS